MEAYQNVYQADFQLPTEKDEQVNIAKMLKEDYDSHKFYNKLSNTSLAGNAKLHQTVRVLTHTVDDSNIQNVLSKIEEIIKWSVINNWRMQETGELDESDFCKPINGDEIASFIAFCEKNAIANPDTFIEPDTEHVAEVLKNSSDNLSQLPYEIIHDKIFNNLEPKDVQALMESSKQFARIGVTRKQFLMEMMALKETVKNNVSLTLQGLSKKVFSKGTKQYFVIHLDESGDIESFRYKSSSGEKMKFKNSRSEYYELEMYVTPINWDGKGEPFKIYKYRDVFNRDVESGPLRIIADSMVNKLNELAALEIKSRGNEALESIHFANQKWFDDMCQKGKKI